MPNEAEIRTRRDISTGADPSSVVFKHHRAGTAEIKVEQLTGGRLLHLAVAGCIFNNVLRLARDRGIEVHDAGVRVSGDFTSGGDSTGIECNVNLVGDAAPAALTALAQAAFDDSTVVSVLRRGAEVRLITA